MNDTWIIAIGVHDRYTELHRLDHDQIERRLETVNSAVASSPSITGDVLVAALLTGGSDPFKSGGKVRDVPCKAGDLTAAELADYLRPFEATTQRWGERGVVLHDGLPAGFIAAHPALTFCRVNPAGVHNYERRWYAWRDWMNVNPGIGRVWFVDINDVYFTAPPFDAIRDLAPGHVAAAVESNWTYAGKSWYADQLKCLPPDDSEFFLRQHAIARPFNCGAWAADAATTRQVLDAVCSHITRLEAFAIARHPDKPVVCDMIAFGRVLLDDFAGRVHQVPMDGTPLIHDRPKALAAMPRPGG